MQTVTQLHKQRREAKPKLCVFLCNLRKSDVIGEGGLCFLGSVRLREESEKPYYTDRKE